MKYGFVSLLLTLAVLLPNSAVAQVPTKPVGKGRALVWYCPPCKGVCDQKGYAAPGICPHCAMTLAQRSGPVAVVPSRKRNVAILVFEGMQILDFAGPSEVFTDAPDFNVYTVGVSARPIVSQDFVTIVPRYTLANCPAPDVVVVPGGDVTQLIRDEALIRWLQTCATRSEVLLSVCTGAGLLGKAGLLDGRQATTFHSYLDPLQRANPKARIVRGVRFVDNGQIITTAGISAGIDGALHVVAKLKGEAVARRVAQDMEYDKWQPNAGLVVKAAVAPSGKSAP